jgi:hypothetical protein
MPARIQARKAGASRQRTSGYSAAAARMLRHRRDINRASHELISIAKASRLFSDAKVAQKKSKKSPRRMAACRDACEKILKLVKLVDAELTVIQENLKLTDNALQLLYDVHEHEQQRSVHSFAAADDSVLWG